jgi:hypothetical protein
MVKKRIFFLVILHVALTLVSCANGEDAADVVETTQGFVALDAVAAHNEGEAIFLADDTEDLLPIADDGTDTVIVKKKRKKRVKKTTTAGPYVACENTDFIIESRKKEYDTIPEGYTAEECVFSIINTDCEYRFECGTTITEAPLIFIEETTEEPDADASLEEDEDEECEPKKKIKFDNCFLKIRGLIKKKKPKRCD